MESLLGVLVLLSGDFRCAIHFCTLDKITPGNFDLEPECFLESILCEFPSGSSLVLSGSFPIGARIGRFDYLTGEASEFWMLGYEYIRTKIPLVPFIARAGGLMVLAVWRQYKWSDGGVAILSLDCSYFCLVLIDLCNLFAKLDFVLFSSASRWSFG